MMIIIGKHFHYVQPTSSATPHTFYQRDWYQNGKGKRERGEGGVSGYPERIRNCQVERASRTRASDCTGVEAPWPLALALKATKKRYQEPEDARNRRSMQGGQIGGTGETEGPARGEPPRGRQATGRRPR